MNIILSVSFLMLKDRKNPLSTKIVFRSSTKGSSLHPKLDDLYREIYNRKDRTYRHDLDQEIRQYANDNGFVCVRDDDSRRADFRELPIIANYFYHEEVKKFAKKNQK